MRCFYLVVLLFLVNGLLQLSIALCFYLFEVRPENNDALDGRMAEPCRTALLKSYYSRHKLNLKPLADGYYFWQVKPLALIWQRSVKYF